MAYIEISLGRGTDKNYLIGKWPEGGKTTILKYRKFVDLTIVQQKKKLLL